MLADGARGDQGRPGQEQAAEGVPGPVSVLACIDVDYRSESGPAVSACLLFRSWLDPEPTAERVAVVDRIAPYKPGSFYLRELPCALAVLELVPEPLEAVVVDGYVWLDGDGRQGMGAHLYETLGRRVPVVGVAKNPFKGSEHAEPVLRGRSEKPLFVTAAGMDPVEAAGQVRTMHGAFRVPTLLRRVDRLCRTHPVG